MSTPNKNYSNLQLAEIFTKIADLLEIKGEVIYKILAYRKAADSLVNLGREAVEYWKEGRLTEIPGVGKAIAEKIDELLTTGRLEFLERLEAEVPPTLVDLLQVPDLGPKKVALFWKQLNITTLAELEAAARSGQLRGLPGMGEKSEARLLLGIEALSRRSDRIPLGKAWPFTQGMLAFLRGIPGVEKAEAAGSLRRMRSTVGDIDLVVAAADSTPVMQAFTTHPDVERVLGSGPTKASVEFRNNLRAQLWVHHPSASAPPCSSPPARKTTTSACASLRSSAASRFPTSPSFVQTAASSSAPAKKKSMRCSACPGSRRSCAKTAVKSRLPWQGRSRVRSRCLTSSPSCTATPLGAMGASRSGGWRKRLCGAA